MKKTIALLGLIVLIVFCFVGCTPTVENETFTVTYNIDGQLTTEIVISGQNATKADPVKEGYIFIGWYEKEDCSGEKIVLSAYPITKDLTLYAGWEENKPQTHVVTYSVDGVLSTENVVSGQFATKADPIKEGYIFSGWYEKEDCSGDKVVLSSYPVTKDIILYADWKEIYIPKTCVVSFDLAGGTVDNPISNQSVTEGTKAECPESVPVKEGYIFIGWYNNGELFDFEKAIDGDVVLIAQYKVALPSTKGVVTASSEVDGHTAQHATDGDSDTYWLANEESATLTIDLESINEIRSIRQIFNSDAAWQFVIEGSIDGEKWAELATNAASSEEKADYNFTVNGYFRYVRLSVKGGGAPSSKEFFIEVFDKQYGTNVALGMKGSAGNWAAGFETEKAFDGNYNTFWCANDGGFPQYLAVEWTYTVYVESVEFAFANEGTHNYEVEARLEDGSWIKLSEASDHVGQMFRQEVKREVNAVLIREFSGPGWANVVEFNVYGFKNVASFAQKNTIDEYDVYALGDSFIRGVVSASETIEYSVDGKEWKSLASGLESANVDARYIRVQKDQAAKIFATQYKTDLARYLEPTVSDYSNEEYRGAVATMNPENVWAAERFWCASFAGGEHTFELDLGNICIIDGFRYEFQDNLVDNNYKLKIEFSTDNENWVNVYDTFANGASGKVFEENFDGVSARYIKITVEYVNGWSNCKNLQIYGVGAPIKPIEIR